MKIDRKLKRLSDVVFSGVVAVADVPNANGRVYTRECLEDIQNQMKEQNKNIVFANDVGYLQAAVGKIINSELKDNSVLTIDCQLLDTPLGSAMKFLSEYELAFNMHCVGAPDRENIVREVSFVGVGIVPVSDFSDNFGQRLPAQTESETFPNSKE